MIQDGEISDGEDPDAQLGTFVSVAPPAAPGASASETASVLPVAALRERLGLTQAAFAAALRIPVATLRNWEQGRTHPEPVARAFFALVADDPARAFAVLAATD